MTSPARRGRRHLGCHFSNDGGAKRRGGEQERSDLRRGEGEEGRGASLFEMCPVPCQREDGSPLAPTFFVLSSCVSFSPPSASLYSSIPQFIPLPLLLWGPIWLKWNLFLIFFLIKIWESLRVGVGWGLGVLVRDGGGAPVFH